VGFGCCSCLVCVSRCRGCRSLSACVCVCVCDLLIFLDELNIDATVYNITALGV